MIEIRDISFAYGKTEILNNISVSIEEGALMGILGNNGAGKSTFITCLNRIHTPLGGTVLVDGKDVLHMPRNEAAHNVSYVAQKNEMNHTTVFDSVLLGRRPYIKWALSQEDLDICDDVLDKIGLSAFKLRYLNELSGGELQKVMLARALVQQPKLLLLDEPTSNLDPKNQYEMLTLVKKLAAEKNIAVLMAIHDLSLALRYCDKFLFLKNGAVYACGDQSIVNPQTIYDVYGINARVIEAEGQKVVIIK